MRNVVFSVIAVITAFGSIIPASYGNEPLTFALVGASFASLAIHWARSASLRPNLKAALLLTTAALLLSGCGSIQERITNALTDALRLTLVLLVAAGTFGIVLTAVKAIVNQVSDNASGMGQAAGIAAGIVGAVAVGLLANSIIDAVIQAVASSDSSRIPNLP